MGYVHRTPAWAGPLGAKARRTYWGVVPAKPVRGAGRLPPHPDEVSLPQTFGQWYRAASTNLGLAERLDLGLSRILAGAALVLLQFAGLLPSALLLAAVLGAPLTRPGSAIAGAGGALLVVTWIGWLWYRRHWAQAWQLRQAWSWAINEPEVLALPVEPATPGLQRDIDTDPEATHPFRARELFPIAERPFIGRVIVPGGLWSDRVRGREALRYWLLATATLAMVVSVTFAFLQIAGAAMLSISIEAQVACITMAIALLPPLVGAWTRWIRRLALAQNLADVEVNGRDRWIAWQRNAAAT